MKYNSHNTSHTKINQVCLLLLMITPLIMNQAAMKVIDPPKNPQCPHHKKKLTADEL